MLSYRSACPGIERWFGYYYDYENFLYFPDRVISWYPCSSTSMELGLRRVVPAAALTTNAKPHAQQQLARELVVERAAMGQSCRPQSFGKVHQRDPQPCR